MKRTYTRVAIIVSALLSTLTVPAVVAATSASAAETCKDEFSGAELVANVVGTNGADVFGPNEPTPFRIRSGDIISTLGGRDVVKVDGLAGLTICLGDGNDQVTGGANATTQDGLGYSVRGGPGDDSVSGTPYNDVVRGLEGANDWFTDATNLDSDICRQFEMALNCEIVNPPF